MVLGFAIVELILPEADKFSMMITMGFKLSSLFAVVLLQLRLIIMKLKLSLLLYVFASAPILLFFSISESKAFLSFN